MFIGDASESTIRAAAQKLEQFREVLVLAIPGATMRSPVPTVVIVFNDARSLAPYRPEFQGRAVEVAGFFISQEDINYIVVNAGAVEQAFKIVFHEYSHFLLGNWIGASVPVWLGEGLAEVYATFQERNGGRSAVLGAPEPNHLRLLQNTSLIPVQDLIAVTQMSPIYNEGDRRGVLYAESWALVHYLMYGNKARAPQLTAFLAAVKSGAPHEQAFRDAFGDVNALDRELNEYIRLFTFPALQLNFGEKVGGAGGQRGVVIPDPLAAAYLGDLLARLDRTDEARAALSNVLQKSPDVARAACVLGLIHLRAGQYDEAMPLLERATTLAPDDPWVQTALGRALVALFEEPRAPDDASALLPRAREVLTRAVERDPDSAYTRVLLGRADLLPGGDLERATSSLERAVQLTPGREDYRLLLAQAFVRQGQTARATDLLGPLMASGSRPETRERARFMLGDMAERQRSTADAARSDVPRPDAGAPPGSSPSGTAAAASRAPRFQPDLRRVGPGETRVLGIFRSVDCRKDAVVLNIDQQGRVHRLSAAKLDNVEFISYRQNAPTGVSCGAQPQAFPVLATFRAPDPSAGVDGYVVAIEMVEDGYVPR